MKKHAGPIFAAILLLVPVLYVVSYFALVDPPESRLGGFVRLITDQSDYRLGGHFATKVFWPLEQSDRKLRPGVWHEE